ncbi:MAG TPA: rhodanese-like domain-containing protein [Candidatus Dormibacteraeota bacterium]|nr:rhodanese-like domain-containing protein [Candidatus Dormibacteraeota bacterium]
MDSRSSGARRFQCMARVIDRNEVRRLVERELAQLVEVLPREEFDSEHIAGAINLPLPDLNAESAERLDRARPVIAYCHDFQ